jgi:hypothetical protein
MQYPLPVGRVAVGDECRLVGQDLPADPAVEVRQVLPVVRVTSPSEEFADPAVVVADPAVVVADPAVLSKRRVLTVLVL